MRDGDYYSFPNRFGDNDPIHVEMMGIDNCHANYRLKRVGADIMLLAYVVEGRGCFVVDNVVYEVGEGDVVLLPRGSNHEYYPMKNHPLSFLWFNVGGDLIGQLIWSYKLEGSIVIKDSDVGDFFAQAIDICRGQNKYQHQTHRKLVSIVFNILLSLSEVVKARAVDYSSQVVRIKTYIDTNVEGKMCMEDMSTYMDMSCRQLNRVFKLETGKTPYSYFLDKKIALAKRYLINTNFKVKEISERLSFSDPYYFSNAFKNKVGLSPAEYKKKTRQYSSGDLV